MFANRHMFIKVESSILQSCINLIDFLKIDYSSAQRALTTLSKKNVKVKYARDESMSHNTLTSTQSLDSNASVTKKTAIAGDECVFTLFIYLFIHGICVFIILMIYIFIRLHLTPTP